MSKQYWFVLLTYAIMQLSAFVGVFVLLLFGMDPIAATVSWMVGSFIVALVIILIILKNDQEPIRSGEPLGWGWSTFWVIGGLFLALFAQNAAFFVQERLFGTPIESENTQMLLDLMSDHAQLFLAVAIVGPILEEIVFRKIIFGTLYKRMNFFLAAVISSVIFSAVHLEFTNILVYTAAGFVFAYLYVKTKRILVPILAHCLMNAMASIPVFLDIDLEELERGMQFALGWLGVLIR